MNYPIWWTPEMGGGMLIALISIVHVYVAHFAVGAGLFVVLTEYLARKRNDAQALDYLKRHTKFFLLLTLVFGGVSGVGIWFIIGLAAPSATSTLIHTYVFAWAAEWVFFLCEIVALIIYHYRFDHMDGGDHFKVGCFYFLFAWLSLFVINGIIGSMLTPGQWLETGRFWDGFFNPSFWPSLAFRSFLAFTAAGLFAFVTAIRIKDEMTRNRMTRYAALWVALPFSMLLASAFWYLYSLPEPQMTVVTETSTQAAPLLIPFIFVSLAVVLAAIVTGFIAPQRVRPVLAALLVAMGLLQIGMFEWIRESGRRPYVIHGHTYSNSIRVADVERLDREGILPSSLFTSHREVPPDMDEAGLVSAGQDIFALECLSCHSIGGPMLDILPRTAKFQVFGMDAQLTGQGRVLKHMPPFVGTPDERKALASYIALGLHDNAEPGEAVDYPDLPVEIPPFDADTAEFTLLAWNNLGMHCISDSDSHFVILPPANDLFAVLIRRGPLPELVTEGVEIRYQVEPGFEHPEKHVPFWDFAKPIFGADLETGTGLSGNGVSGSMHPSEMLDTAWEANLIPVVPYTDQDTFNPYPLFTITAVDPDSGETLAETRTVAPTSTEMGCRNCHGGEWRLPTDNPVAGFSEATSSDILEVHDRINGTDLAEQARAGNPRLCQSCHPDPVLGAEGNPELLNLPAALHGWHANYLRGRDEEACASCHPNNPDGPTRCLRGFHDLAGLTCVSCHGALEDHALSLLKAEYEAGKPGAERLMQVLAPRQVASIDEINGRVPWLQEPDCTSCHDFEERPDPFEASAFNKWTGGDPSELYRLRTEDMQAIPCEACHGSPHAVYPAANPYGIDRDNIAPLQYQGFAASIGSAESCFVCHGETMDYFVHHPVPGM